MQRKVKKDQKLVKSEKEDEKSRRRELSRKSKNKNIITAAYIKKEMNRKMVAANKK